MKTGCLRLLKFIISPTLRTKNCRYMCSNINNFTWRSHTCGELNDSNVGQEVTLCGWISAQRFEKFLIMNDTYGITQIVFDEYDTANKNYALSLPPESVIEVKGLTIKRPNNKINRKISTGDIEVLAKEIKLLNACKSPLPFTNRDSEKVNDTLKQKYRYLALRNKKLQDILRTRSKFLMKIREFLHNHKNFIEVETPTLFHRTPGGAKEFIVPTKFPGRCYSLVQSPQQFKQLLMVGGIDKYFQIARCYRNEGTKPDRQPEFTQLDIELSFTTDKYIQNLVEQLLKHSWPKEFQNINIPFPCLSYVEAMRLYGTDKPDIRYELLINDVTELLKNQNIRTFNDAIIDSDCIIGAFVVALGSNHIKKQHFKEYQEKAKLFSISNLIEIQIKNGGEWNSILAKHVTEEIRLKFNDTLKVRPNDKIFIAAGNREDVSLLLGKIRKDVALHLKSCGVDIFKTNQLSFVWIIDFPMFLKNEGKIESAHHPFTAPRMEDIGLVYTDPLKARSLHYDLVLNGQEIAGGSIRIHDSLFQKHVLEEILQEDPSSLQHLLDGLSSGCPPHGGIALGIDRIIAIMCGCHSISEVIAFPKSLDGKDLMSGAPAKITKEDEHLYHIKPEIPSNS